MLFDPMTEIPVSKWLDGKFYNRERLEPKHYNADDDFSAAAQQMRNIRNEFITVLHAAGQLQYTPAQEMLCGMWGEILVHEASHLIQIHNGCHQDFNGLDYRTCADEWRLFEQRYSELWHRSNKPSEYSKLRDFIINVANYLDSAAIKMTAPSAS